MRLFIALTCCLIAFDAFAVGAGAQRPNIILINLDDADFDVLSPSVLTQRFPAMSRMVSEGIYFTNLHVTTPICGPSRACLLRAQYAHNTGVRVNDPNSPESNGLDGGMAEYFARGHHLNDLSIWMQNAGYHTIMIGKYLHADVLYTVPPGWDDFYHSLGGRYYETSRFTTRHSATGESERLAGEDYRTTMESQDAIQTIEQHIDRNNGKPFFMYLNPFAPHRQGDSYTTPVVESKYRNWWPNARMPLTPDFNEFNFSDKTDVISWFPLLSEDRIAGVDAYFRQRLLLMRSVDDMFAGLMQLLEDEGIADNTYIFLTSDNGFHNGHQRTFGKGIAYDRSSNVPLYVWGPAIPAGKTAGHLLAHIDIGPTVVDLAGGETPSFVDGRSFVDLLTDPHSEPESTWRQPVLIENYQSRLVNDQVVFLGATSIRTYDEVYSEWADGSSEYYDLLVDPLQLRNRINQVDEDHLSYLAGYMRALKQPLSEPTVSMQMPLLDNELFDELSEIRGMAEDDSGVDRVMLTIKSLNTLDYWDGSQWQEDRIRVKANTTNPGHQLTTWRYNSAPPKIAEGSQTIAVYARAYDQAGNYSSVPTMVRYHLTAKKPLVEILGPTDGSTMGNAVTIHGRVSDDRPLRFMRLIVRHVATKQYWTGTQWSADWAYIEPEIQNDLSWSVSNNLPDGAYVVSARIRDIYGNMQDEIPVIRFTVE